MASKASRPGPVARALIGLVNCYRLLLSAWLGASCRFEPTCSAYALTALQRHGALTGSRLAVYRILRCNPFCQGGHDPVPDNAPALFSRLLAGPPCGPAVSPTSTPKPPHD